MEMTVQVNFDELLRAIDKLSPEQREAVETVLRAKPQQVVFHQKRQFGSMSGLVTYIADDFDAPLDDFSEYI